MADKFFETIKIVVSQVNFVSQQCASPLKLYSTDCQHATSSCTEN